MNKTQEKIFENIKKNERVTSHKMLGDFLVVISAFPNFDIIRTIGPKGGKKVNYKMPDGSIKS